MPLGAYGYNHLIWSGGVLSEVGAEMGAGQRSRLTFSTTIHVCCFQLRRIQCHPLSLWLLEYKDSPTPKIILRFEKSEVSCSGTGKKLAVDCWRNDLVRAVCLPLAFFFAASVRVGVMLYSWSWDWLPVDLCRCSPMWTHIQMCMLTHMCTCTYTQTYM